MLELYKCLIQAVGMTKEVVRIDKEVKKIKLLSNVLNEELGNFIKIYGVESLEKS